MGGLENVGALLWVLLQLAKEGGLEDARVAEVGVCGLRRVPLRLQPRPLRLSHHHSTAVFIMHQDFNLNDHFYTRFTMI
jgi:hypothetical protein